MSKTLRQHIDEHRDIHNGTAIAIIITAHDILAEFPDRNAEQLADILEALNAGAGIAAILDALSGLIEEELI